MDMRVDVLTADSIERRRGRQGPGVWLNDEAQCRLYQHGEPGSTGEEAQVQPNYLLWARDKREARRRRPPPQTSTSEDGDAPGDLELVVALAIIIVIIVAAVLAS